MPKMRGAIKSPRHVLLAAVPHVVLVAPPPQFVPGIPRRLDYWGNDVDGDCVSAEEAFAKAVWSTYCGLPETFATAQEVIAFARQYGYLNGATLTDVMDTMKAKGMVIGGKAYTDGGYSGVNFADETTLQSALTVGPVKIAIDADALPQDAGNKQGWFATAGSSFPNTDHCVSVCGYGPAGWLYQQLGVPLPAGLPATTTGYLVFTWSTIGFVTHAWLMGTCTEAWVRSPTTPGQAPTPPNPPDPPNPPTPTGDMLLQLSLRLTPPHALTGTYTLTQAKGDPLAGAAPAGVAIPPEVWSLILSYVMEYGRKVLAVVWPVVQADLLAGRYQQIPADVWAAIKASLPTEAN